MCLQYGVPVAVLAEKFAHMRFEPSDFTSNPDMPVAKSIVDYIFRFLRQTFGRESNGNAGAADGDQQGTGEA